MTFKLKLILSNVLIQVAILIGLGFGGLHLSDYVADEEMQIKALDMSKFLEPVAFVGIQKKDALWFKRTAKLVLLSEDIAAIQLIDANGKVLVDESSKPDMSGQNFLFRKNIVRKSQNFGQLNIILSDKAHRYATNNANEFVASIVFGVFLFTVIFSVLSINILLRKYDDSLVENQDESHTSKAKPQSVKEVKIQLDAKETKLESKNISLDKQQVVAAEATSKKPDVIEFETIDSSIVVFPEIIKKSLDVILLTDDSGRIIEFNSAAEKLFGFSRMDIIRKNIVETLLTDTGIEHYSKFLESVKSPDESVDQDLFESNYRMSSGDTIELNTHLAKIKSDSGIQIALYLKDISQIKATENRLNYLAFNDELTDLPNLSLLSDHIRKATFEADAQERQLIIIKLGLDGFKHINESMGHRFGDYLLRSIATRLKSNVRRGDMVSRINGDQFVVALVDVSSDSNVDLLVQKYLDCFLAAFEVESKETHISASIGATLYPNDEKTVDGLLRNAESAMFRAKEAGGNNCQFFSQEMRKVSQERLYMENELRKALDLNQFVIHYQPQVNLSTGKIIGVEALIRWIHPEMGLVPPLNFIPLAEELGLIVPIGEWVLKAACQHNMKLMEDRGEALIVAVNLSVRQFKNNDLVKSIADILSELKYPPELLELEITESLLMENMGVVTDTLNILSEQGIRISMDDFGTGYSSLSYLKNFPINTLKVDRSFVQDLENDENNASIVAATIEMAHSLNIDIVAEGVETEGQLKFLATKKCDKIQGYYFSRPLEAGALRELLDENLHLSTGADGMRLISGLK